MPKNKNPLSGLSEAQIRELIESADVADDSDDSDDGLEITIRGKNAKTVLEHLGIVTERNYEPDDAEDPDEPSEPEKAKKRSIADRILGTD